MAVGGRTADTLSPPKSDKPLWATMPSEPGLGRLRSAGPFLPLGALQRSSDSGKSWQTIQVANNVVFRALAANDSDIWVGGAAAALYHSSDAGQIGFKSTPRPAANR